MTIAQVRESSDWIGEFEGDEKKLIKRFVEKDMLKFDSTKWKVVMNNKEYERVKEVCENVKQRDPNFAYISVEEYSATLNTANFVVTKLYKED